MKTILTSCFTVISCLYLTAQIGGLSLRSASTNKGEIYALIVGISDYQDPEIDDLSFAHRDAEEFAAFLQSKAGGNVSPENITLLTEQDATIANIYTAKQSFENKIKKDDRLYFYFSGHGDMESSLYKLGFLIAYDTPNGNYLNNAIRIEDLNNMANTLSVEKNAEVVLITDACHSGKLAGAENKGTQLVGSQLSTVQSKEIRIASCQADQLSEEDKVWGGGRGAFSYHLINGLKGLADTKKKDGKVSLKELEEYIGQIVPDEVFSLKESFQDPIIEGKSRMIMSIVDPETLRNLNTSIGLTGVAASTGTSRSLSNNTKLNFIRSLSSNEFAGLNFEFLTSKNENDILSDLKSRYKEKSEQLSSQNFKEAIVTAIHNMVQIAINAYLDGSEAELERRQYYATDKDVYLRYINMLAVALKLAEQGSDLHHILNVKYHYFKGLNARLKLIFSKDIDTDLKYALSQQSIAYRLDSMAPYVVNEMGVLKNINKDKSSADYYKRAALLAPKWAIPKSNLSNYYYKQGDYLTGEDYARKAIKLNEHLFNAYINLGNNARQQGNLLLAEESYNKAERLNQKHFRSARKLAHIYAQLLNYKEAEYYHIEAEHRLEGLTDHVITNLEDNDNDGIIDMLAGEIDSFAPHCSINPEDLSVDDVFSYFKLALESRDTIEWSIPKKYYEKALVKNLEDPIIYKYLADLYRNHKLHLESEYFYKKAIKYYLDHKEFLQYAEELKKKQSLLVCSVYEIYTSQYFDKEDLYYLLADTQLKNGNLAEVEEIYSNSPIAGRYESLKLLSRLYESQKRYKEAEQTIAKYQRFDEANADLELIEFYNRRVRNNENETYYRYARALIKYKLAKQKATAAVADDISIIKRLPSTVPGTNQALPSVLGQADYLQSAIVDLEQLNKTKNLDTIVVADLQYKLAYLYRMDGQYHKSKESFKKAMINNPANASSALSYMELAHRAYDYEAKLNTLDQLYERKQLSQDILNDYANFTMKVGRADRSNEIIKRIRDFEITSDNSLLLTALLNNLLAKNYNRSMTQLSKLRGKGVLEDYEISYTQAVIHAKQKDKKACYASLRKAVKEGFPYRYVLSHEKALKQYESDEEYFDIVDIIFQ